jgi:hypothetical protein
MSVSRTHCEGSPPRRNPRFSQRATLVPSEVAPGISALSYAPKKPSVYFCNGADQQPLFNTLYPCSRGSGDFFSTESPKRLLSEAAEADTFCCVCAPTVYQEHSLRIPEEILCRYAPHRLAHFLITILTRFFALHPKYQVISPQTISASLSNTSVGDLAGSNVEVASKQ